MDLEPKVKYVISTYPSKYAGYQSKKGNKGTVKVFISTIYKNSSGFYSFTLHLIHIILHERICLERAFNKIRIKGGMCKPCCVEKITDKIMNLVYS